MIDKKLQPCEDIKQNYKVDLIVKSDSTITLIKNSDTLYIKQNKCAYEMVKKALPYLENWIPARYKEQNLNAIYTFDFSPDDIFFENEEAEFPGGLNEFRNKFTDNLMSSISSIDNEYKGKYTFVINFTINEVGRTENIQVTSNDSNNNLLKNAENVMRKINDKWKPAKIHGVYVKYRMRIPFILNFE